MLSCLVPRFGQEDMPSSTKFDLQFPPMGITKNDDDSSSHNSEYCSHCQQEFSSLQALKDHIMQTHQSLAGAETTSSVLNSVAQHFSPPPTFSPGNFPFPLAPGVNDNKSNSQSRSPNNNTSTHACSHNQCSASFSSLELLEKHEMLQHSSGATNVSCRLCHKTFANVYRLQRHMISHDESALLRKFKCTDCDKAFKFKHHLKEHLRIHSGEKPFGCPNCGKRFSHSGSYSSHMTSKKCISMGLKMNGTSLSSQNNNNNINNNNNNHIHPIGTKNKSEEKQQQPLSLVSPFVNQTANANSFLPMLPNLNKYNNYEMMMPFLASLTPFYSMGLNPNLNPYHIQNLLKLTGVQNFVPSSINENDEDDSQKTNEDDFKTPVQHSNPEDLIEEVNEHDESKLVMDLKEEDDEEFDREYKRDNNKREQDYDENEPMNEEEDVEQQDNHETSKLNKTKSPSPLSYIKRENISGDDSVNDLLRCQHCDKTFNHPTEHLQHEKMFCSVLMKRHEMDMMNGSLNAGSEDDDLESKVSTESERKVRVRTAISDEQQAVLKDFYTINSRPNRDDFRNIAQRLMLDPRVVQVWFQNNRSRERKQNGMISSVGQFKSATGGNQEQPLDLSMKRGQMKTETPTRSPRYEQTPYHQQQHQSPEEVLNLSRKIVSFSPIFQSGYNSELLTRQVPSPNEAVPLMASRNSYNGYNGLPLGLPLERLLQLKPEMMMMKAEHLSGNSLSPGSSERRSWKDDESRSFDETLLSSHQQFHSQRRVSKMKSELPPDSEELQFVCDLCDKAFRKQSSLARHKYEHSGQRPFKCTECPKAFKHRHHLTEHKRLHSGEKPFQCSKCLKRFSHSGSYSQHMNHRYSYCKPYRD